MSYGQFDAGTGSSDFNSISFLIQQAMVKMQTVTLVKVIAVHGGGVSITGTVDVQPMVNQTTGDNVAVAHGTIYGVPFFRAQGGTNALIVDPVAGDIGMCCFASRDISSVKSTRAVANPGSKRVYDWADGLYVGGFANISPTQYIKFDEAGITVVSPTRVTVRAPVVEIDANASLDITSPTTTINGALVVTGTTTLDGVATGSDGGTLDIGGDVNVAGDATIGGTPFLSHIHPDPQGGNTGPPV
jgi:hypothetical protein